MIIYSASELGSCTKYLVAKQCGFEAPTTYGDDIPAFKEGHRIEGEVLEWLQNEQGYTITATQKELYLSMGANEDGEPIVIQCHPDAIGTDKTGKETVIEIKSASDSAYKDFLKNGWEKSGGLFPRYLYQVSAYRHVTGLPVTFVVRNKEYDVEGQPIVRSGKVGRTLISYESDCPPLLTLDQLRARVDRIERMVREYAIPDACDYPNYLCPLAYLHEENREFVEAPTIDQLAREYSEIRAKIKQVKNAEGGKRLNIRNKILKEMGVDPWEKVNGVTTRIETPNVKCVAIWGVTGFPVADWDQMRADGIDVEKYRKAPRMGYKLNVWVRGEKRNKESENEGDE